MNEQIITLAEERVKKRAEETAYKLSEGHNIQIQTLLYNIYKRCIILGARFMQEELMEITDKESSSNDDVNVLASFSYDLAIKRGKTGLNLSIDDICNGIGEELEELRNATEKQSKHIPDYTEQQEELADVILAGLTELRKICEGKCFVSDVLSAKIEYNRNRKN